jgi:putative FmdB family regulatory protein
MPLYEFDCSQCGAVFEKLVRRAGGTSEIVCPVCGSRKVDEKISAFASITKGGSSAASVQSSCAPSGG